MTEENTERLVGVLNQEVNEATDFESTDKFNSASDNQRNDLVNLIYQSQDLINRFEMSIINRALKASELDIYSNEITLFTNLMKTELAAL